MTKTAPTTGTLSVPIWLATSIGLALWPLSSCSESEAGTTPEQAMGQASSVATSNAEGFRFDAAGRFSHLIDPRSGFGAKLYRSVAVVALDASAADAFSTAFSLLKPDEVRNIIARQPGLQVRLWESSDPARLLKFGA